MDIKHAKENKVLSSCLVRVLSHQYCYYSGFLHTYVCAHEAHIGPSGYIVNGHIWISKNILYSCHRKWGGWPVNHFAFALILSTAGSSGPGSQKQPLSQTAAAGQRQAWTEFRCSCLHFPDGPAEKWRNISLGPKQARTWERVFRVSGWCCCSAAHPWVL